MPRSARNGRNPQWTIHCGSQGQFRAGVAGAVRLGQRTVRADHGQVRHTRTDYAGPDVELVAGGPVEYRPGPAVVDGQLDPGTVRNDRATRPYRGLEGWYGQRPAVEVGVDATPAW